MSVVVVVVCWFVSPFFSAIGLGWSKKHIFFFFKEEESGVTQLINLMVRTVALGRGMHTDLQRPAFCNHGPLCAASLASVTYGASSFV